MSSDHRFFIPIDFVSDYEIQSDSGSAITYFAVAKVESLPTDLPLTPNLRRPSTSSKVFKQILKTLLIEPERFIDRNNGIKITAKKVEKGKQGQNKGIWVDLGDDRTTGGVVNGGHTLAAIRVAQMEGVFLDIARVKVEILCGLSEQEVSATSVAVNTSTPVDVRSKLNALGRFEPLKALVKEIELETGKRWKVSWYQNQEGVNKSPHCSASHINDLLLLLDRQRFNFNKPGKKAHPYGGITSTRFNSDAFFERQQELFPLLQDAFWIERNLYELLEKHLKNPLIKGSSNLAGVRTTSSICLLDGKYYGFTTPCAFSFPVITAYRVFLSEEAPCNEWVVPFEDFAPALLKELWKWYKDELRKEKAKGNATFTPIVRDPIIWSSVCTIAQEMLRTQFSTSKATPRKTEPSPPPKQEEKINVSNGFPSGKKLIRSNRTLSGLHQDRLSLGVEDWNKWRERHPEIIPDLKEAVLSGATLANANLERANLAEAYLNKTDLSGANLSLSDLNGADLTDADLSGTLLQGANFKGAIITGICVEDCFIDTETSFDDVICDYIYLKRERQKRCPKRGNFGQGEFAKLFRERSKQ